MEGRAQTVVLIGPLNWGLGHATRCVPIINALLFRKCKVMIAAEGASLAFLQKEFSDRAYFLRFRGKSIRYPSKGNMLLSMALQTPGLLFSILREHRELKKLVRQTGAKAVISDNRYGLWNKNARTVLITHQLFIRAPKAKKWLEPWLGRVTRFFVKKFDICWVPDFAEAPGLSGALSHKEPLPGLRFIGPLSRFTAIAEGSFKNPLPEDFPADFFLVVLSGPEPQRSIFEVMLWAQFQRTGDPVVFVQGKPDGELRQCTGNAFFMNHAKTSELAWLVTHCRMIICRPGYSTIMDLSVFGKKALLIPTPGQTEQEYLGQMLTESGQAFCVKQSELDLATHVLVAEKLAGIKKIEKQDDLLENALNELLGDL
ncbi:MAG: hypothetical protein K0B09_08270 [Bacteroidales bacterium]|nr:hypothetical protein [Bacteroidales bacterium]